MIIHITRHGQVDPPALAKGEDPDYPRGDAPISDLGRTQARLLGQRLRELGFSGVIHSSPYRRTIETAHATIDELHSSFSRVDSAAHCFYPWWTSRVESPDDVEARVAPFVDQVAADGIDALLVGHGASTGGAIRHIMRHGTPDGLPHDDPGWNCALTSFRMPPNFTAIRLMDVSHLPGEWVTSNVRTRDQILAERGEEETE